MMTKRTDHIAQASHLVVFQVVRAFGNEVRKQRLAMWPKILLEFESPLLDWATGISHRNQKPWRKAEVPEVQGHLL